MYLRTLCEIFIYMLTITVFEKGVLKIFGPKREEDGSFITCILH